MVDTLRSPFILFLIMNSSLKSELVRREILERIGYDVAWPIIVSFILSVGIIMKRIRRIYILIAEGRRNGKRPI